MSSSSSPSSFLSVSSLFGALKNIKNRNLNQLKEKSRRLEDPQIRSELIEYLKEETTGSLSTTAAATPEKDNDTADATTSIGTSSNEPEEQELLDADLAQSQAKLKELEAKQAFVFTRLQSYQNVIDKKKRSIQLQQAADKDDDASTKEVQLLKKYESQLDPIRQSHAQMTQAIQLLKKRIRSIQKRQYELQMQRDECQVVLETLQELQDQQQEQQQQQHEEESKLPTRDLEQLVLSQEQQVQQQDDSQADGAMELSPAPTTPGATFAATTRGDADSTSQQKEEQQQQQQQESTENHDKATSRDEGDAPLEDDVAANV